MENQGNSGRIVFAELDIEGRRIECPSCRVPISPHLGMYIKSDFSFAFVINLITFFRYIKSLICFAIGNLILPRFQCENCRANLSYRNGPGRTVRCPCCHFARPVPRMSLYNLKRKHIFLVFVLVTK